MFLELRFYVLFFGSEITLNKQITMPELVEGASSSNTNLMAIGRIK
jgi:hypothetical protein